MKLIRLAAVLAAGLVMPAAAMAGTICPSFVGDPVVGPTGCNTVITIDSAFNLHFTFPDLAHPYDGNDDNLVGVINNAKVAIFGFSLTGGSNPIFAFDGDGINTYTGLPNNSIDTTGYGGPNTYFSIFDSKNGIVNFISGIGAGDGTGYFSLESTPIGLGPAPEPSSFILLGTGALGLVAGLRRRFLRR